MKTASVTVDQPGQPDKVLVDTVADGVEVSTIRHTVVPVLPVALCQTKQGVKRNELFTALIPNQLKYYLL